MPRLDKGQGNQWTIVGLCIATATEDEDACSMSKYVSEDWVIKYYSSEIKLSLSFARPAEYILP